MNSGPWIKFAKNQMKMKIINSAIITTFTSHVNYNYDHVHITVAIPVHTCTAMHVNWKEIEQLSVRDDSVHILIIKYKFKTIIKLTNKVNHFVKLSERTIVLSSSIIYRGELENTGHPQVSISTNELKYLLILYRYV